MRDIILDTDPGHDDALAIILAVRSGIFNIEAITTVAGNTTIENTTRNASYILDLLGKKQEIPIYSGSSKPIKGKLHTAIAHGGNGLEGVEPETKYILTRNAVNKIVAILASSQKKMTLVTLGPLTNVAKAIKKDASIEGKIEEIVMMGGSIRVGGNITRAAEFNVYVDPEAAETVFKSSIKKTIIPLDACLPIELHADDFLSIEDKKLRDPIMKMMRARAKNTEKITGDKVIYMFDPLTIYFLINPGACLVQEYDIRIETDGELTRGMTVADLRPKTERVYPVDVVERIDENKFKKDFFEYVNNNH